MGNSFGRTHSPQPINETLSEVVDLELAEQHQQHPSQDEDEDVIRTKEAPSLLGISVWALRHVFLEKDVIRAGFSETSSINDIENLRGPPGVIRQKGQGRFCPVSNKEGAAYVHCLQGENEVGKATHMLSYTWRYVRVILDDGLAAVQHRRPHRISRNRILFPSLSLSCRSYSYCTHNTKQ
jgi:hypothetical protein